MQEKVFLIFNTACLGDVILCNSLCQNIRLNFPDAKIVFIVDKPFQEAAEYQQDVDEVVVYDKKGEHKGFKGMFKFVKNFPYKKPCYAFLTYKNERNLAISILLRAKCIITPQRLYSANVQLAHTMLLSKLKNMQVKNLPNKYNVPKEVLNNIEAMVGNDKNYITICCVSKNIEKDMPIEVAKELIDKINKTQYKPIFVGAGEKAFAYSKKLEEENCDFVSLVNKTSITELAGVLKQSKCLISVDTGTMHLGCAVACPVITPFYRKNTVPIWAPKPELYKSRVITDDFSAENLFLNAMELIDEK